MGTSHFPIRPRSFSAACYDAAVTDIRMRPKGLMPGQGSGSPNFELQFRVIVN